MMKVAVVSAIILVLSCAPALAQTEDQCAYDLGAMMRLEFDAFDRTPESGWRVIGNTPGCESAAADLIARYRAEKIEDQRRGLMHHEAQLRAAAGQTDIAIALIEQVRAMEAAPEMIAYRNAEIAFLRGDLAALRAARDQLLAVPAPPHFEATTARFRERFPDQPPPTWPLNIEVVNGFVACFGRPYSEAYTAPCRRSSLD